MKDLDFIARLRALGIELQADGEKLHVSAPPGIVTDDLLADLKQRKAELLALMQSGRGPAAGPLNEPIAPVARDGDLPLSWAQQRLWLLNQIEPESFAYNIAAHVKLSGQLDVAALEKSLNEIIRRHESLRTIFVSKNGEPVQVIKPHAPRGLEIVDLRSRSAAERWVEVQRLSKQEAEHVFRLAQGPLLRMLLVKVHADVHVLMLTLHHVVFDGWSTGILMHELGTLYNAFSTGTDHHLPELTVQYADYAHWQRHTFTDAVLKAQLAYWRSELGGRLPQINLPLDRPRPREQLYRGALCQIQIDRTLLNALHELSLQNGATLFMTLLAVFNVLLLRHSGDEDILVGTPIANRKRTEAEGLIGFFLNTLVIRSDLGGDPPFLELLARVREKTLKAYSNQDLPFEKLLEDLQPVRDLSRTPLFQVMFVLQNAPLRSVQLHQLTLEPLEVDTRTTKFDLNLHAIETGEGLLAILYYNTDLFDAERISSMLDQYEGLLKQVAEDPEKRIGYYSLLSPSQEKQVPDPTELLAPQWAGAVHKRFSEQAVRLSGNTAIIDTWGSWSYGELERCSNQVANQLRSKGVQPGDVVAIYGHRSAGLVLSLLGVLKAGGAFQIVDPQYPASRLVKMLEEASPRGWLQMEAAGPVAEELHTWVDTSQVVCRLGIPRSKEAVRNYLAGASAEPLGGKVSPDDTMYVLFTSGTTGQPKGIVGTHRPLSHFINWHCEELGFNSSDRFSMLSGLSHDPLLRDIFSPLWVGGTLCIPKSEEMLIPERLRHWMREQGVTVSHMTPALSQVLTEGWNGAHGGEEGLPALHHVFFGGDILTRQHVERIRKVAPKVECVNFYGTSETPQAMGYHVVGDDDGAVVGRRIPLGRGIEGAQLLILNQSGRLAGVGELGEIYVRTPYLTTGYLNDDALTRERYIPNPFGNAAEDRLYRTGDLGRYLPDGEVMFDGRSDSQVSIRGFRVELGEIEANIKKMKAVGNCVVVSREDKQRQQQLVAYYVLKPGQDGAILDLKAYIRSRLPEYMVPQHYVELVTIPLTPNGKVDYERLPVPPERKPEESTAFPLLETQLVAIWENILGVSGIGLKDNFFDVGGHSLLALRLMTQMETVFGRQFPLSTIFQTPTIEEMAAAMKKNSLKFGGSLVAIQTGEARPPLFVIPGFGGSALGYGELARLLGPDQPVYSLQSLGLDGTQDPLDRVEDIGSDFLDEIRRVQLNGPYHIAGFCTGGAIAFEIAQQLSAQDQKVATLILVQTFVPGEKSMAHKIPVAFLQVMFATRRIFTHLLSFKRISPRQWLVHLRSKLSVAQEIVKVRNIYRGDRAQRYRDLVQNANLRAFSRYSPKSYKGTILYIMPSDRDLSRRKDPILFWEKLAEQGFKCVCLPGEDSGFLLKKPYVMNLADLLRDHLGNNEARH